MYFSPTDPHILASGSEDRTIRIWNILGGDVECKDGEILSENFPQADADEGTCLVAVLAGEGYGGHRAQVCDLVSVRHWLGAANVPFTLPALPSLSLAASVTVRRCPGLLVQRFWPLIPNDRHSIRSTARWPVLALTTPSKFGLFHHIPKPIRTSPQHRKDTVHNSFIIPCSPPIGFTLQHWIPSNGK